MFAKQKHGVPATRIELLRQLPMFAHYPDEDLASIDALVDEVLVPAGSTLTTEGQPGREAFIVVSGEAEIRVGDQALGTATAGELVGEMSLLDNQPRSATVTALTPLRVLVIDPRQFGTLLQDPRTARWLATSLSQRLRGTDTRLLSEQPT
jgi:cAMP-dependent protein kinase regulator